MLISMLKYIKIHKGAPTYFDLNRSPSGSRSDPCGHHVHLLHVLLTQHWDWNSGF